MEQTRQITVIEALKVTADMLRKVEIPIGMTETVAIPIARSVSNIDQCIMALEESDRKAAEKQPDINDLDISIEPVTEDDVR